jgi:hypothetical protein
MICTLEKLDQSQQRRAGKEIRMQITEKSLESVTVSKKQVETIELIFSLTRLLKNVKTIYARTESTDLI